MEHVAVNPLKGPFDSVLIQNSLGIQLIFLNYPVDLLVNQIFQFSYMTSLVAENGMLFVCYMNQYCDVGEQRHINPNVGYF